MRYYDISSRYGPHDDDLVMSKGYNVVCWYDANDDDDDVVVIMYNHDDNMIR